MMITFLASSMMRVPVRCKDFGNIIRTLVAAIPRKKARVDFGTYQFIRIANLSLGQTQNLKKEKEPLGQSRKIRAERILAALEAYKLYKNIEPGTEFTVPVKFTVPHEDERWDQSLWGMQLGIAVQSIRIRKCQVLYHDMFRRIGLDMSVQNVARKAAGGERIAAALEAYKLCKNIKDGESFTVPHKFVVPHGDAHWDPSLWGLRLGTVVSTIRSVRCYAAYHDKFRSIGLTLSKEKEEAVPKAVRAARIVAALEAYKVNNNIDAGAELKVPSTFVVPHGDARYDPSLWGLRLGKAAKCMRTRQYHPAHHEKVRSMGLSLEKGVFKGGNAERILAALEAYKLFKNIAPGQEFTVPRSFTVPHGDTRWDPSTWGMLLGKMVKDIRVANTYASYHDQFRSIGLRLSKFPTRNEEVISTRAQ